MSFLLKRKKFFIFVFFFLFFSTNINIALGQSPLPPIKTSDGGVYNQSTGNKLADPNTEAAALYASNIEAGKTKGLGDMLMGFVDGLIATALPLAAAFTIPFSFIAFGISSLVLGISSYLIDLALEVGVNLMSQIVNSKANSVKTSWEIFRNLANVGIIFTILFIAIKTILRSSGYDGKVLLGRVIIAALLINFSFLFGAIVVDVSNEMSLTIYEKVKEITNGTEGGDKARLGSYMMDKTDPAFFQSKIASEVDPNAKDFYNQSFEAGQEQTGEATGFQKMIAGFMNLAIGYIMGTIANLVLAAVLFISVFMIFARIIIILLLLVVSPIAFAAMVLPNTQKLSKEWWESLIGQSFFLPAFLLFLVVGLKIAGNLPKQNAVDGADQLQVGLSSYAAVFTPVIFNYMMVIGLFIAALMAAKKVQSMGSAAVGKISTSITNATGGAVSAAGAFAGRNTIGRGAEALSNTEWAKRMGQTRLGSLALDQMKGVAKSSFDTRESRAFKGVASATGVGGDFAKTLKPQKDGFIGSEKRALDRKVKRGEYLSNDLTAEQEIEKKNKEAQMQALIDNDLGVKKEKQMISDAESELEAAKATGHAGDIKDAKKKLAVAQTALAGHEASVKGAQAYKDLETEAKGIISARAGYVKTLNSPLIKSEKFNKAAGWIPFNGRATDRAAAKKLDKGKSAADELFEKWTKEQEKNNPPSTP